MQVSLWVGISSRSVMTYVGWWRLLIGCRRGAFNAYLVIVSIAQNSWPDIFGLECAICFYWRFWVARDTREALLRAAMLATVPTVVHYLSIVWVLARCSCFRRWLLRLVHRAPLFHSFNILFYHGTVLAGHRLFWLRSKHRPLLNLNFKLNAYSKHTNGVLGFWGFGVLGALIPNHNKCLWCFLGRG